MATPTRVLHVSDTRLQFDHAPEDGLGGIELAVERAVELGVDALLHTGNLASATLPDQILDRIRAAFDTLQTDGIRLCYVAGRRDLAGDWNPWAPGVLGDHPAVEQLDRTPTDIGDDLALFGIEYRPAAAFATLLDDDDRQFTPASGVAHQVLAVNQAIAPPVARGDAAAQAFEVATSVNLYLDAIAAGGTQQPRLWEHDDSGLGVYYPGTTNPDWRDAGTGPPEGVLYEATGEGTVRHRLVSLSPTSPTTEITDLRELLSGYETADLDHVDTETLIDLYGLTAEARSVLDDRRKEVRDVLLERTAAGETASGTVASVHHQRSTSRRLRDDEAVLAALERAGVDRDRVVRTIEEIDPDAVETVVETDPGLDPDDVFEERVRETIRKQDLSIDDS